jgi:hypothetical protein
VSALIRFSDLQNRNGTALAILNWRRQLACRSRSRVSLGCLSRTQARSLRSLSLTSTSSVEACRAPGIPTRRAEVRLAQQAYRAQMILCPARESKGADLRRLGRSRLKPAIRQAEACATREENRKVKGIIGQRILAGLLTGAYVGYNNVL